MVVGHLRIYFKNIRFRSFALQAGALCDPLDHASVRSKICRASRGICLSLCLAMEFGASRKSDSVLTIQNCPRTLLQRMFYSAVASGYLYWPLQAVLLSRSGRRSTGNRRPKSTSIVPYRWPFFHAQSSTPRTPTAGAGRSASSSRIGYFAFPASK